MISSASHEQRPIAADTAVLCLLVLLGPQLFGGAFPWAIVTIAAFSLLALAVALWVRRASAAPVIDGLFVTMSVAWLWTAFQALPLPSRVASVLDLASVASAERLRGLAWVGEIPLTISRDPGSTCLHILIGIIVLASFLAARLGGPSGLRSIVMATVVSAVLLGLEGLLHNASGSEAVFGVYAPRFTQPRLLTPLMNGNHLGGFALLGAILGAGLAVQGDPKSRHRWTLASAFCALTVAWTLSRGAIGSLLFGFVVLGAWLIRRRRVGSGGAVIPIAALGAAIAGTLAFAGLEPILRRFEAQGLDKLAVAARGLRLLEGSAWWLGIGRGAFSSTFAAEEGSLARYTHPENILVQWTTEWGVPLAFLLLAVLVAALWKRFRIAEQPVVAAACIAVLSLSAQNLVDFSLEMAGIVVAVAVLLGALLPASSPSEKGSALRGSAAVFAVLALTFALLGPGVIGSDTQSIVDRLAQAMKVDDEARFETTLQRGLALHPGEPSFAVLAGTYAGRKKNGDAPRWLSIAMEEAPGWSAPHVVAAQLLLERGLVDQALLEIREAERRHAGSARSAVCAVMEQSPSIQYLERAAPDPEQRVRYLDRATTCQGLPVDLRVQIDLAILQTEPTHPSAVLRQARRYYANKQPERAKALLQRALNQDPDNAYLWVAIIRAHLDSGDLHAADSALADARARGLEGRTLTEAQARVEAALGHTEQMRATLSRLRGQSRGRARLVAAAFLVTGQLEASLGNLDEAFAAYEAADAAKPDTPALQYAAKLALESGRPTYARQVYRRLCARQPDGWACAEEARLSNELRKGPGYRLIP